MGDVMGPTSYVKVRLRRPSTRDGLTRGPDGGLLCPFCGEEVTDDDRPYVVTPEAAQAFLYCPYCGGELHDCD